MLILRPRRRRGEHPTIPERRRGFPPAAVWAREQDRSETPDSEGDPLRTLALGVLLSAAADLRLRGDPHGMRDWLAGEDGAPWIEAALGGVAAERIRERAADPAAWAAIVDRAADRRLRSA